MLVPERWFWKEVAPRRFPGTKKYFPESDIAVFAAAVADYAPENVSEKKIKREHEEELIIRLKRNPDIAASMGKIKTHQITVGFALETHDEIDNARKKLKNKNLDMVVLNSMQDPEAGFMKDTNKVSILTVKGELTDYPVKSKREVAKDIIDAILRYKENGR